MSTPYISVIIPTYNRMSTIKRAIDSVRNQTYQNFEIIVVDDASTDDTRKVIEEINDERIRYIYSQQNRGAGYARNIGIKEAIGDYIAFQDSDDEWLENKLKIQVECMEDNPDAMLCYTRFCYDDNNDFVWPPKDVRKEEASGRIFDTLLYRNFVGGPTMMIRKECFSKVGMFLEDLRALEDYELALRIAANYEIALADGILVKAHSTPGSLSKNIFAHIKAGMVLLHLYKEHYIRCGLYEAKVEQLRDMGRNIMPVEQVNQLIGLITGDKI